MKLTSSLRVRPDFLYLGPMMNVVVLLLVPVLLSSQLVVKSGIKVEPPRSSELLEPRASDHEVTITGGEEPSIYLDGRQISPADLPKALEAAKAGAGTVLDINADAAAPHGLVVTVRIAAQTAGCEVRELARPLEDP